MRLLEEKKMQYEETKEALLFWVWNFLLRQEDYDEDTLKFYQ